MGAAVGPVARVSRVRTRAYNKNLDKREAMQVSRFYREFFGYDSLGRKAPQGIHRRKPDMEA